MLPELVLDNEQFEDIMAEARNMIVSLYPEWTDFNYHDPGITLIELFSWMKESQQFFMDQISAESREKYLKLLGVRRRTRKPAAVVVQVTPPEDLTVLPGTRLYADEVCFEAQSGKQLIRDDVIRCFSAKEGIRCFGSEGGGRENAGGPQADVGHGLPVLLFGTQPERGCCFYMGFSHRLPEQEELDIWLELAGENEGKVRRNPLAGPMPAPLADFRLQYCHGGVWRDADWFRDETGGGLVSGRICFRLIPPNAGEGDFPQIPPNAGEGDFPQIPPNISEGDFPQTGVMDAVTDFGEPEYYLRLLLEQQDYDVPPVLAAISINRILLRQRKQVIEQLDAKAFERESGQISCAADTMMALNGRNELYLNAGGSYRLVTDFTKTPDFETGRSHFRFDVAAEIGEIDGICIISAMAEDMAWKYLGQGTGFPGQEFDLGGRPVESESFALMVREADRVECYLPWLKVRDFSGSGPEDRHYVLDSLHGVVRFGNCIRGLAPEGDIIITSCAETLGSGGNVKAYAIDRFDGMAPEDIRVHNRDNAWGGRDEESIGESFLRVRKELRHSDTAVSDSDYERYVMAAPGLLLENCRVIPAAQMRQMRRDAEDGEVTIVVKPYSPDGAGSLSDCYRKNILAYLESYRMVGKTINLLSPQYVAVEIYADIELRSHYMDGEALVRGMVAGYFAGLDREFGATVRYSDLYGIIDTLDCVRRINALNVDVRGIGVQRGRDGTITLPPHGVVRLGEVQYLFNTGE